MTLKLFLFLVVVDFLHAYNYTRFCSDEVCFYFDETKTNRLLEAQEVCRKSNRKLLEIKNERVQISTLSAINSWIAEAKSKNNYPLFYLTSNYWLNLKDVKNSWRWVDGTSYSGFNNMSDKPNELIAYVEIENKKISIKHADSNYNLENYICSTHDCKSTSCLTRFYGNKISWYEARKNCQSIRQDLSVLSWIENADDLPYSRNSEKFWVGLTDRHFYWKDSGTYAVYTRWRGYDYSNNINKDCAIMAIALEENWFMTQCNQQSFYVICMEENAIKTLQNLFSTTMFVFGAISAAVVTFTIVSVIKKNFLKPHISMQTVCRNGDDQLEHGHKNLATGTIFDVGNQDSRYDHTTNDGTHSLIECTPDYVDVLDGELDITRSTTSQNYSVLQSVSDGYVRPYAGLAQYENLEN